MNEIVISQDQVRQIAVESAREAITAYKTSQKRGRKDEGRGSKILGNMIRSFRETRGWSISELAELSGLHPTTVGKLESGQRGMGLKTFAKLSGALGLVFQDNVLEDIRET